MKVPIKFMNLKYRFLLLLTIASIFSSCDKDIKKTEILWDNYGVPHIYGRNTREMYYSFGWAQMSCHADLILRLYAEARGVASEFFGKEYIESDKRIHAFNLPEISAKGYQQLDPEIRSYVDSFVQGMNDYAEQNQNIISAPFRRILPVTPIDILAHTQRVIYLEFLAGSDLNMLTSLSESGSNAIAVGSSRSASGNAMLISNPHLPWYGFYTWFEAHLITSGFDLYGVALVGMPVLSIAFNENLGWTHTVNTIDASDRYELILKKDGYLLDNKIVPFSKKSFMVRVKEDDGSVTERKFELKLSEHGPVLAQTDKKAWAVRIAGLENFKMVEQYHRMGKAKNLSEFESALKMLQNPMFNVIYADKEGNIFYLFEGNVPKRSSGDFSFWSGTIDGSKSDYIWKETHPYNDLPRVLNPPSGFLQNCNDPPWTCTYPAVLDPSDFPAYMSPDFMGWRAQRAVNMIKDDIKVTYEQMINYKLNTEMEVADRFLDDLLEAVKKYPNTAVIKAAEVLSRWDKKTDSESRGAVLFAEWWNRINRNMFRVQWDPELPVSTPDGLADEKQAVNTLKEAAQTIKSKYGNLDVPWGEVYRYRLNNYDYPANGGPDHYGIFRAAYYIDDQDNRKRPVAGDTYFAVTEFGKKVRASVLLSYGNASQAGNKHIGDQLKLMSEKKLRPALLERSRILENLEKRELLKPILKFENK